MASRDFQVRRRLAQLVHSTRFTRGLRPGLIWHFCRVTMVYDGAANEWVENIDFPKGGEESRDSP